jgi:hypothetical protein
MYTYLPQVYKPNRQIFNYMYMAQGPVALFSTPGLFVTTRI